jgi:hypothetical protein
LVDKWTDEQGLATIQLDERQVSKAVCDMVIDHFFDPDAIGVCMIWFHMHLLKMA